MWKAPPGTLSKLCLLHLNACVLHAQTLTHPYPCCLAPSSTWSCIASTTDILSAPACQLYTCMPLCMTHAPGVGCSCYASPINRAARFAEIMWEGRETPLVHTDSLKEAYLGWLQGMKQGMQPCRSCSGN